MQALNDFDVRALFITAQLDEADPIWGQEAIIYQSAAYGWIVLGNRCGSFSCGPGLRQILQGWSEDQKARLTTWINDQNRAGERFPGIHEEQLLAAAERRPLRFGAKVERFFQFLESRRYRVGQTIYLASGVESPQNVAARQTLMRWTETISEHELHGFMVALQSAGLVDLNSGSWQATADGLLRIDALEIGGAANDQAFIAMWFGAEMEAPYEQGIVAGLAEAGYRAFRIDRKEHSNKIDDEIIAEIRRSRFVVEDFTCGTADVAGTPMGIPRGGVYYEAGFAQGLNMPVIWTVREDQIGLVHFDTRQFNHITWKDPADLRIKLYRRVAAVIGHFGAPSTRPAN